LIRKALAAYRVKEIRNRIQVIHVMYMVNVRDVERVPVAKDTYKGKRIWAQYLITDKQGARKFHMRIFTIEPHESTPPDQHIYEHEILVLKGRGRLLTIKDGDRREVEIGEGDAIFIESNEIHQFFNDHDEPLIFLCIKGAPEIYRERKE